MASSVRAAGRSTQQDRPGQQEAKINAQATSATMSSGRLRRFRTSQISMSNLCVPATKFVCRDKCRIWLISGLLITFPVKPTRPICFIRLRGYLHLGHGWEIQSNSVFRIVSLVVRLLSRKLVSALFSKQW